MNAQKVDEVAALDRVISHNIERGDAWGSPIDRDLRHARRAMAELIERDKAAAHVFDCILRGVNDLSGPMGHRSEQLVAGWLESWAKSLHAAGFKPSDPAATDITRAIARIGGAA